MVVMLGVFPGVVADLHPGPGDPLGPAGLAATLLPIMKKVALAPASARTSSNRSV